MYFHSTFYTMPWKIQPIRIQESCCILDGMTSNLPIMRCTYVTLIVWAKCCISLSWYKIVIQCSHIPLVACIFYSPKGLIKACVYTTREHCITTCTVLCTWTTVHHGLHVVSFRVHMNLHVIVYNLVLVSNFQTSFIFIFQGFLDYDLIDYDYKFIAACDNLLYNDPLSYSCISIGSHLWSIKGQMHDWRHHYKVFPSVF